MKYDFDTAVNRVGTDSVKWGVLGDVFGNPDAIPMWVADMDFQSPKPIIDALTNRAAHGVFGYGRTEPDLSVPIQAWLAHRHDWDVPKEAIVFAPGVLCALSFLIAQKTQPGDGIIIETPVYHPFARDIQNLGRKVVGSSLKADTDGVYRMDFDDLRAKAKTAKFMILCSPHNPVGRVWSALELRQLSDICREEGVFVVSDEIHADLILPGHKHTPFLSVAEGMEAQAVVLMAPSKTFNIAGLHASFAVILDEELRTSFRSQLQHFHVGGPDIFSKLAMYTAYTEGEEWLEQLLPYLQRNVDTVLQHVERIPQVKAVRPEGTYLMWLDCRNLGLSDDELEEFLNRTAGVAVNQGKIFGEGGNGFIRVNIGCPHAQVVTAFERLAAAVSGLPKR